jgi:hypothetical protein
MAPENANQQRKPAKVQIILKRITVTVLLDDTGLEVEV